jgi:antitoxin CptB
MSSAPPPALLWHCRRGMRELEQLLEPFVEHHYHNLAALDQRLFFDEILAAHDGDLLQWLLDPASAPPHLAPLLQKITAASRKLR